LLHYTQKQIKIKSGEGLMKYEEWVKYENVRRQKSGAQNWVNLDADQDQKPAKPGHKENEKKRFLSAILQVFNQRSI